MMEYQNDQESKKACPIVYSLRIVGRKWLLPVLCELNRNPSLRYLELKRRIPDVSNMALTQVLKELADRGLIRREQFNEIPPHVEYSITEDGIALLPALYRLARWGMVQMEQEGVDCTCIDQCFGAHYEYVPPRKEAEMMGYTDLYNSRYHTYYEEIHQAAVENGDDILTELEEFLSVFMRTLIEDGPEVTRWTMTYFFREDTINILQYQRPQYEIICNLLKTGKEQGLIACDLEPSYLMDQLSKIITGMVGEWLMAKSSYDVLEYSRPMLHWVCQSLRHSG